MTHDKRQKMREREIMNSSLLSLAIFFYCSAENAPSLWLSFDASQNRMLGTNTQRIGRSIPMSRYQFSLWLGCKCYWGGSCHRNSTTSPGLSTLTSADLLDSEFKVIFDKFITQFSLPATHETRSWNVMRKQTLIPEYGETQRCITKIIMWNQ